jgi:hypothetical protein
MLTPKERAEQLLQRQDYYAEQLTDAIAAEIRMAVEDKAIEIAVPKIAEQIVLVKAEAIAEGKRVAYEDAAKIVESSILRHEDWVECTLTPEQLAAKIRAQANELVSTTDGSELLRLADNLAKAATAVFGCETDNDIEITDLKEALTAYERLREGK